MPQPASPGTAAAIDQSQKLRSQADKLARHRQSGALRLTETNRAAARNIVGVPVKTLGGVWIIYGVRHVVSVT